MTAEQELINDILSELARARTKFPGDNVTTLAMVEEAGELATAVFEEPRSAVRKEAIQVAVMAMRVILDGDATLRLWRSMHGLDPLVEGERLTGAERIAAERRRQIEEEGWTAEHDAQHRPGILAGAGSSYAMSAALSLMSNGAKRLHEAPPFFKFDHAWWKPRFPLADLIRAGALIAAEIDRLQSKDGDDDA